MDYREVQKKKAIKITLPMEQVGTLQINVQTRYNCTLINKIIIFVELQIGNTISYDSRFHLGPFMAFAECTALTHTAVE